MTQHLDNELSAYLDGELAGAERQRVDAHLALCPECRRTLEDLRRLVHRASTLDDRPPERDLWPGIADRIGAQRAPGAVPLAPRRRRILVSVPQLAAAAVALMVVSAGATVLLTRGAERRVASGPAAGFDTVGAVAFPGQQAVESYDAAIRDLQQTLAQRRPRLDTATARVIEQSLAIIDRAIAQARGAVARDPNNLYLNGHLQRALDRKLDLLRQVAMLPLVS
jgi:anti-sigma factor RsiW